MPLYNFGETITRPTEDYKNRTTNYTNQTKIFRTTKNNLMIQSFHRTFNNTRETPIKINHGRTNPINKNHSEHEKTKNEGNNDIINNLKFQLEILKKKKVIVKESELDEILEDKDTFLVSLNNNTIKNEKEVKDNDTIDQKVQKVLLNSTRIMSTNLEGFKRTIQEKDERLEGNKKK